MKLRPLPARGATRPTHHDRAASTNRGRIRPCRAGITGQALAWTATSGMPGTCRAIDTVRRARASAAMRRRSGQVPRTADRDSAGWASTARRSPETLRGDMPSPAGPMPACAPVSFAGDSGIDDVQHDIAGGIPDEQHDRGELYEIDDQKNVALQHGVERQLSDARP